MKSMFNIFPPLAFSFLLTSCGGNSSKKEIQNSYRDAEMIRIHVMQDEQNTAGLLTFFSSTNEYYRAEAALAFASVQDTIAIDPLISLISDASPVVRKSVAYSLGQFGNRKAREALYPACRVEGNSEVRATQIEAIGKLTTQATERRWIAKPNGEMVEMDLPTYTFQFLDSIKVTTEEEYVGWAKAVFQMNLKGLYSIALMDRMPYFLQYAKHDARVAFAHAMARYEGKWFQEREKYITSWISTERDPETRVPLMTVIGKIGNEYAYKLLLGFATGEQQNKNVQLSALRSLKKMKQRNAQSLLPILNTQDDVILAEALVTLGTIDCKEIINQIKEKTTNHSAQVQALASELFYNNGDKNAPEELLKQMNDAKEYNKIYSIQALGRIGMNDSELLQIATTNPTLALRYASAEALASMQTNYSKTHETSFYNAIWKPCMLTKEIGVCAVMATSFDDKTLSDNEKREAISIMNDILKGLSLPREIETYNEIVKALVRSGQQVDEKKAEYNHPINWDLVKTISSDQKVKVTTDKGNFIIALDINAAPGTVSNFIQLTRDGFFNDKYFHRVVPAFVIQGGCPRGDGMGGTDYTIRSEFTLHNYIEGAVGMASSGKDTESCQWFSTIGITPSLEGRYSIFGYLTEGFDVAQNIRIGDKIIRIEEI